MLLTAPPALLSVHVVLAFCGAVVGVTLLQALKLKTAGVVVTVKLTGRLAAAPVLGVMMALPV